MCPLSPQPQHPPVPSPTMGSLCCPAWGWHRCPLPHDQGTLQLSWGQARATTGDLQCCATPWGNIPPVNQCHPGHAGASVTFSAPPAPSLLLVAVGGFPELVSHHFGREVVEVEHVLEEGVLRDLVLVRKRRDDEGSTLARMHLVPGCPCITLHPKWVPQIGTLPHHGAPQGLV